MERTEEICDLADHLPRWTHSCSYWQRHDFRVDSGMDFRASSLRQYARGPLVVLYFGSDIGTALSVVLLLGLAAAFWQHRQSDLLFQVPLSVSIFQAITPYEPYNVLMLLIPVVWIVDNAHEIAESGAVNQIALAAVRVALILS